LAGLAATGKGIAIDGVDFIEVRGGKIVAVWGVSDQLRVMRQIGAIPS
jgi:predicted ester cyclase